MNDYDEKLFTEIRDQARELKERHKLRDKQLQEIDQAFLMNWVPPNKAKWNKAVKTKSLVISPDFRNNMLGMARLVMQGDPLFRVVYPEGNNDTLEDAIQRLWAVAGRQAGVPLHYDLTLSSVLYAEMHAAVTSTKDLLARARKAAKINKNLKGEIAFAEKLAATTPYLVDVWHPLNGYPDFDRFGRLSQYYREVDTTVYQLMLDYGDQVPKDIRDLKRYDVVTLQTFYDRTWCQIWTNKCEEPIVQEKHDLPRIPIMVGFTEGSKLWTKPEDQRQPPGMTLLKSGMWSMQNMIYTVMFTLVRDMGATPLYVHTSADETKKKVDLDYDETPAIVELTAGETFQAVQSKGLIDPAMQEVLQLTNQKTAESTIYPQALGQPMGDARSYSEVALMAQAGRLPLTGTQKRGGWAIAGLAEMLMEMWGESVGSYKSNGIELKRSDIPKNLQIECKLDVKLPQDKLQLANIANLLKTSGLASDEWIQSNILNVENATDMWEAVHSEREAEALFQDEVQFNLQKLALQHQQEIIQLQQTVAKMQGQGQPPPGQQQPGPQRPNLPPVTPGAEQFGQQPPEGQQPQEMQAGPMMGNPGQGQAMQGGLPQAQAGLIPGAGLASAPENGGMPNGQ